MADVDAFEDLVTLWHALHDYLLAQGTAAMEGEFGLARLSQASDRLYSEHNRVHEKYIAETEQPVRLAGLETRGIE